MIETDSMDFIIAISFTVGIIMLIIFMYGFHLVVSGNRLRKARRLSSAVIDYTPAIAIIVFDERERVVEFSARSQVFEGYSENALNGKTLRELRFLPGELRNPGGGEHQYPAGQMSGKTMAPLAVQDGRELFIEWEMQDFTDSKGKIEFRIATGFDRTELLQTQKKLKLLSAKMLETEEEERRRIAENLHNRIGEILLSSSRTIEALQKESPSQKISQGLDVLSQAIHKFTDGTRSLIFKLNPMVLYDIGLGAAVEFMASQLGEELHVTIEVDDRLQDSTINPKVALFLYKAIQEFIFNALKHSSADEILITLNLDAHKVEAVVQDNGSGFRQQIDELTVKEDSGFGLLNIKNRAEIFEGGVLIAESVDLGGGQITVWAPWSLQKENHCS